MRVAPCAVVAIAMPALGGCYYLQAIGGQLEVMRKREPIPEVLEDPTVPDATRERLGMVLEARRFAVDELGLPDNDSYRTYADLERDYVVWNVFAAPEFSLEPKTWCFPIVGCVAYRGYFDEAAARRHAAGLEARGYDVYVGGVPAYSTLGRFDDPVLNTMMRWTDADLVATVFHELAHQRLYVKGDTGFNEAFATAVAEIGLERWLTSRGQAEALAVYRRRIAFRKALVAMAEAAKVELEALYADGIDVGEMRRRKRALLDDLSRRAVEEAARRGFEDAGWLRAPLNNARLVSVGVYRSHLGAFRALYQQCDSDLSCFYAGAEELADLPAEQRRQRLDAFADAAPSSQSGTH